MEQRSAARDVADRVDAEIKSRGISVVWLCQDTGIPRATMLRRLGGHTPFNVNELERIAASLRVTVADLMQPVIEVSQP